MSVREHGRVGQDTAHAKPIRNLRAETRATLTGHRPSVGARSESGPVRRRRPVGRAHSHSQAVSAGL